MAADASPDDVRLSRALLLAVGERCSAVRGPCHLEDAVVSPDGLHAQAAPRRPAVLQILDELGDSSKERFLRVAVICCSPACHSSVQYGRRFPRPGRSDHRWVTIGSESPMGGTPLLPAVGLGTAPLGGLYAAVSPIDAAAAVAEAVEIGYRYFDTAPLYGYGAAERALGRGLEGCGAQMAVSTKVGRIIDEIAPRPAGDMFAGSSGATMWDFSADGVRRSLEASLKRLGRSYIDVVFIHDPDHHARQALDEAYPALERLRDEGVIGAVGVGMNEPKLPTQFVTDTDIDAVLIAGRYTLLDQSADRALFSAAMARGVHVIAAGVYNSGILAAVETNPHFDYAVASAEIVSRARQLQAACDDFGVPLAAAAVQFVVRHPAVGTVLLGARSQAEAAENWSHTHAGLPDDLWTALDEIIKGADDVD